MTNSYLTDKQINKEVLQIKESTTKENNSWLIRSIWSLIKQVVHNRDMTSSLPYKQFENDNCSDDQLELHSTSTEINVYHVDGTYETVSVTPSTTSEQLCSQIAKKVICQSYDWSIVEIWKDEEIERTLENHESVLLCYQKMGPEKNRILVLRLSNKMFHMFKHPEEFSLYRTWDLNKKKEAKVIQKVLNGDICPLHFGQVWVYDCNKTKPFWDITILLLKDKNLYLSSNHKTIVPLIRRAGISFFRNAIMSGTRDKCQVQVWAYLGDFRIFTTTKRVAGAPTDHCLCLVPASGIKQYIACSSNRTQSYWMCAMRLSKYGKQLRDNYRSFVKKHNDANEYEYNKKPLPNESVRSHVAMDFSGNVGRIVEDPKEALAIAQAETGSVRRSWRSSGRTTPGLQTAVTKLENDIHLSQPWYHKNMSRDQAANVLNGLGNKDGVFLIRESKSKCGSYVLTFKCGGKIIHTPIVAQMDPINDQVCFTLDNGVIKFYDLLQLVEFYQLNAGSLPTRLMHYVVQVPVTK
ncbi:growth factor receptor-bound protein 14-like isoform X1 [Rhopalosiphum padi]|uniref:growth factor receptor-bound protein 14-like isoform X1 n=2 Tax=Rhopalosiphum padi TaxID=40932 RepID=UPI00298EC675|nr:growth factor receptor-bound protein 14-like isoform X1 [Rhopalosiphum padi]